MRLRRLRLFGHPEANDIAPATEAAAPEWHQQALAGMDLLWLRIDGDLRVLDASHRALELFEYPSLPNSLIAVTRTAVMERHARQVFSGAAGPWEISAANFRRHFRLHGLDMGAAGALLYFDDITELRRLEAVRADFVANLAHELRTPVASLSLAAETLSRGLPPEAMQTFVGRIAEETRYIEGLLRTVTELALLEGDVKLQVIEFRLKDVVIDSWRRVTDRQGPGRLDEQVPGDLWVRADRVRIAEVIQNLMENAHRFTPEGRPVTVGAASGEAEVTIWVADQGPGISPAELPRIFERFYKVDRARTRMGDGSGLGLAISKHLVSAHGGRIWAKPGEASGTIVTFTIPKTGGGSSLAD